MADALKKIVDPIKPRLPANSLKQTEIAITSYFCLCPVGHTLRDVLDREYWTHVCKKLRLYSRIEAVSESGEFDVDLRVIGVSDHWARVQLIREAPKLEVVSSNPKADAWHVRFVPTTQWGVYNDIGKKISDGHANKAEAEAKMAELLAELRI